MRWTINAFSKAFGMPFETHTEAFWNPFGGRSRTHSERVLDWVTSEQYCTFVQDMPNIDIELNLVQEDYRIVRARESVKRRFTKCFVYKSIDWKLFKTQKLPQSRPKYASEKLPINNTGIYFAGPLLWSQWISWMAIAYCFFARASTIAAHL